MRYVWQANSKITRVSIIVKALLICVTNIHFHPTQKYTLRDILESFKKSTIFLVRWGTFVVTTSHVKLDYFAKYDFELRLVL